MRTGGRQDTGAERKSYPASTRGGLSVLVWTGIVFKLFFEYNSEFEEVYTTLLINLAFPHMLTIFAITLQAAWKSHFECLFIYQLVCIYTQITMCRVCK